MRNLFITFFPVTIVSALKCFFLNFLLHFFYLSIDKINRVLTRKKKLAFKNKKIWEIELEKDLKEGSWDSFERQMREIVSEYEDKIENVDFKLDTERIKKDITKHTTKFLNNKKLK